MILTVGVPVVGVRYTAEPLLSRSIPNLQFDARLVHGYNFVLEMIGEGGGGTQSWCTGTAHLIKFIISSWLGTGSFNQNRLPGRANEQCRLIRAIRHRDDYYISRTTHRQRDVRIQSNRHHGRPPVQRIRACHSNTSRSRLVSVRKVFN